MHSDLVKNLRAALLLQRGQSQTESDVAQIWALGLVFRSGLFNLGLC